MSGMQRNFYAFRNRSQQIGDAIAAIWHQRNEEQNAMNAGRKRTVSRAVGAGLVIGGAALSAVLLAGAQAPQVSDNAHVGDRLWVNAEGVNTVGATSVNPLPRDSRGNTIVGFPGPSITVTDDGTSGNTVVGFPGPSITVDDGNGPGNTVVWFPGGAVVTGSTFVF
jgi:hypothetical protein